MLRDGDAARAAAGGTNFDGQPMPDVKATPAMAGASSLYSTPDDILRRAVLDPQWSPQGAEVGLFDHAAYVPRDGLDPCRVSTRPATWTPWGWAGS